MIDNIHIVPIQAFIYLESLIISVLPLYQIENHEECSDPYANFFKINEKSSKCAINSKQRNLSLFSIIIELLNCSFNETVIQSSYKNENAIIENNKDAIKMRLKNLFKIAEMWLETERLQLNRCAEPFLSEIDESCEFCSKNFPCYYCHAKNVLFYIRNTFFDNLKVCPVCIYLYK